MEKNDIIKIGEFIEKQEIESLQKFCETLEINNTKSFDDIAYSIMKKIENDTELMEYFKESSKKETGLKELIKYCTIPENIRFFIDNKEIYKLDDSFIESMREKFNESHLRKIESMKQKREKFLNKTLIPSLVLAIICAIFGSFVILKPYFVTHIIKTAVITEANVIEQERHLGFGNIFTTSIHIKYSYNVEGKEYVEEKDTFIYGLNFVDVINYENTIKIYYDINNPSESNLYINSIFYNIICISFDLMIIIGVIKTFKEFKNKKAKNI